MESWDKAERVPVGYVGCEDLQGFVLALLDQYEEVNQLSWHDEAIPQNEIFIKVGGDHGGDSFKFMLQVGNVKTPNKNKKRFLLAVVNAKDSHKNIWRVVRSYKQKLDNLSKMTWKGKQTEFKKKERTKRVFAVSSQRQRFSQKHMDCWGHTNNNSTISAKWRGRESRSDCFCLATVTSFSKCLALLEPSQPAHVYGALLPRHRSIQTAPNQQPHIPHRMLTNIKADYRKFKRRGKEKRLTCACNNDCHDVPMLDMKPTQVSPPTFTSCWGSLRNSTHCCSRTVTRLIKKLAWHWPPAPN